MKSRDLAKIYMKELSMPVQIGNKTNSLMYGFSVVKVSVDKETGEVSFNDITHDMVDSKDETNIQN